MLPGLQVCERKDLIGLGSLPNCEFCDLRAAPQLACHTPTQAALNMPMTRVGHDRIYALYMTVYLMISLPEIGICTVYIWFWPTLLIYTINIQD
jgi:hypothetical protein